MEKINPKTHKERMELFLETVKGMTETQIAACAWAFGVSAGTTENAWNKANLTAFFHNEAALAEIREWQQKWH